MDKILSWGILGVYFGVIFFALNKGFDFSDEGMYVLMFDPLQPNVSGLLNYDLFSKLIFQTTGFRFGIVDLRVMRLLLYVLAAGFVLRFWLALFPEDGKNGNRAILYPVFLLSLFGGYAFLPQSLSYNSLTVVLSGFLLGIYGPAYWDGKSKFSILLLTGVLLAFLFYTKITVFFGLLLLILVFELLAKKKIVHILFPILLPLFLMESVFGLVLGKSGLVSLAEAFQLSQIREGYGLLHVLKSLFVGFFWTVLIFGSGVFGALAFQNGIRNKRLVFALSSFSLAVFSFYWITITEESTYYALFGILFYMGFLSMKKSIRPRDPKVNVLLLVLFCLPFVLHWGSNVYFMRLGVHFLFLWVLWTMVWLRTYGEFPQFKKAALVISVFLLPFIVDGLWWRPFGQQSIFHQTERYIYQENKIIFIDQEQILYLQNLDANLKTLQAKNLEVLPLYAMPGPIYLLDRQLPKTPGIWNLSHFDTYFADDLKAKVIVFNGSDKLPEVVRRNYMLYEHPEKVLVGSKIYVLKENQDGKGA